MFQEILQAPEFLGCSETPNYFFNHFEPKSLARFLYQCQSFNSFIFSDEPSFLNQDGKDFPLDVILDGRLTRADLTRELAYYITGSTIPNFHPYRQSRISLPALVKQLKDGLGIEEIPQSTSYLMFSTLLGNYNWGFMVLPGDGSLESFKCYFDEMLRYVAPGFYVPEDKKTGYLHEKEHFDFTLEAAASIGREDLRPVVSIQFNFHPSFCWVPGVSCPDFYREVGEGKISLDEFRKFTALEFRLPKNPSSDDTALYDLFYGI